MRASGCAAIRETSLARIICLKTIDGHLKTACATRLLALLLLALPAVVQAQFTFTTNNGAITITKYTGSGDAVTIPSTTNGYPVTSIGGYAFQNNSNLNTVTIPASVTSIGDYAFGSCSNLNTVTIPASVTSLGDWAFASCTSLTNAIIGNGVTSIGEDAFGDCTSLTSITIPNSVTSIGPYAFDTCTSLTSITIPGSIASIDSYVFAYCTSLTNAIIANGFTTIPVYTFDACYSLTSVAIPSSVTSIEDLAFYSCSGLREVYFFGNAPSLGSYVFEYDNNATVYYLPGTTGWASTFGGRPTVLANTLPIIFAQLASQAVNQGDNASFSVSAFGVPPLFYQWQFDSTNIAGATASSLTLTNVQPGQAGNYLVIVSNALGTVTSSNAVLAVVPPPPCATPPAGLVAWWPGQGNANDIAGTNNGVLEGGVAFAAGEVGQAFSLNGVNQYVSIPDSPSLRPMNLTVEGWFNFSPKSGTQSLVGKTYGTWVYDSYLIAHLSSSGTLVATVYPTGGQPHDLSVQFTPVAGTWHHIAFTYDSGTGMHTLYLDGMAVANGTVTGPIAYDSHPLIIGAEIESEVLSYFVGGLIDEVSLYDRALSASEIAAIYNAGSAGKCPVPVITSQPRGQVGYWGKSVTLTVTTAGTAPLSYQWLQNGTPIQGATGSSLVLTNLQLTNAGNYSVVVTNAYGSATSGNAYLTVNPAGVSLALYSGITVDGVVGLTYGIQYSTDLSNTNGWRGMANLTLGTPTELWFDVQPASQPQRYYRVLPGPISVP
jgi:hypothetical protein